MRRLCSGLLLLGMVLGILCARSEAGIIYVNQAASGAEDGTSWEDAFLTIRDALDAANHGDEVWMAGGYYEENLDISKDLALLGGFAGHETDPGERDLLGNVTTIDAGGQGSALVSRNPAIRLLDGFAIRNGSGFNGQGGGVFLGGFRGSIANVSFQDNSAPGEGGGLYLETSGNGSDTVVTLDNVSFQGNEANQGGGLYLVSRDNQAKVEIQLMNVTFSGNSAWTVGGGLFLDSTQHYTEPPEPGNEAPITTVSLSSALFELNTAVQGGGAYLVGGDDSDSLYWLPDVDVRDTEFTSNTARVGGGLYVLCDVDANYVVFTGNGITDSEEDLSLIHI